MEQGSWSDLRVHFVRTGAARYISHLDVNRTMQRAVARSHLPVWYSQGFNPHIYLTFALPTPLGYESYCETMDFRLIEEIPYDEVLMRLNACLPQGLRAISAASPVYKPEAILEAEYEVHVSAPTLDACEMQVTLQAFLERNEITTEKKTKKGSKQIDLKPLLRVLAYTQEGGGVLVTLRLAAGATVNITPTLLFDAFTKLTGTELDCIRVKKRQVFIQQGGVELAFA